MRGNVCLAKISVLLWLSIHVCRHDGRTKRNRLRYDSYWFNHFLKNGVLDTLEHTWTQWPGRHVRRAAEKCKYVEKKNCRFLCAAGLASTIVTSGSPSQLSKKKHVERIFWEFFVFVNKKNFVNSENKIKTVPVVVCSYFQRKYFF